MSWRDVNNRRSKKFIGDTAFDIFHFNCLIESKRDREIFSPRKIIMAERESKVRAETANSKDFNDHSEKHFEIFIVGFLKIFCYPAPRILYHSCLNSLSST